MTTDRRKEFDGLVLRALNIVLNTICRYAGEKTNALIDEWKADARAYLASPFTATLDDALVLDHYERTLEQARADGHIP